MIETALAFMIILCACLLAALLFFIRDNENLRESFYQNTGEIVDQYCDILRLERENAALKRVNDLLMKHIPNRDKNGRFTSK